MMRKQIQRAFLALGHKSSYSGIRRIERDHSFPHSSVAKTLSSLRPYTLHHQIRRTFPRNRIFVQGINDQWEVDLADMSKDASENEGMRYILVVINAFSKKAGAIPLARKTPGAVSAGFEEIRKKYFPPPFNLPQSIRSDSGGEFKGSFSKLLKNKGVKQFFATDPKTKAAIAERFVCTLKTMIWKHFTATNSHRYVDVLPSLLKTYNSRYHRSIGIAPNKVTLVNQQDVFQRLYPELIGSSINHPKRKLAQLQVGNHVRLSRYKHIFEKGFKKNWTEEVFLVYKIVYPRFGEFPMYYVRDLAGEQIKGRFYEQELQKVPQPKVFQVERVLRHRSYAGQRYLFVKWLGYPSKFNSWISATDIVG